MTYPVLTACYGAILGLIFVALSAWVIAGRGEFKVMNADGGVDALHRRIRAHANFAEYVPLALLLIALLEASGAGRPTLHGLLLALVLARLAHPVGMVAGDGSMAQRVGRGAGAMATFLVLIITAVLLLVRLL